MATQIMGPDLGPLEQIQEQVFGSLQAFVTVENDTIAGDTDTESIVKRCQELLVEYGNYLEYLRLKYGFSGTEAGVYSSRLQYLKERVRQVQLHLKQTEQQRIHRARIHKFESENEAAKSRKLAAEGLESSRQALFGQRKEEEDEDLEANRQTIENQILAHNKKITTSLQSTRQLMSSSIVQTELNLESLDQQTKDLSKLNDQLFTVSDILNKSGQIVKFIEKQDRKDKRRIYYSIFFFASCCAWVVWKRILKTPVRILLWSTFKMFRLANWAISSKAVDNSSDLPDAAAVAATAIVTSMTIASMLVSTSTSIELPVASFIEVVEAEDNIMKNEAELEISTFIDVQTETIQSKDEAMEDFGERDNFEEVPILEELPVVEPMEVMEEDVPVVEDIPVLEEVPVVEEDPIAESAVAAPEMPIIEEVTLDEESPVVDEIPSNHIESEDSTTTEKLQENKVEVSVESKEFTSEVEEPNEEIESVHKEATSEDLLHEETIVEEPLIVESFVEEVTYTNEIIEEQLDHEPEVEQLVDENTVVEPLNNEPVDEQIVEEHAIESSTIETIPESTGDDFVQQVPESQSEEQVVESQLELQEKVQNDPIIEEPAVYTPDVMEYIIEEEQPGHETNELVEEEINSAVVVDEQIINTEIVVEVEKVNDIIEDVNSEVHEQKVETVAEDVWTETETTEETIETEVFEISDDASSEPDREYTWSSPENEYIRDEL